MVACGILPAPNEHSTIRRDPSGIRVFTVIREVGGIENACPAFGLVHPLTGVLRGDPAFDDRIWIEDAAGRHLSVVWPAGFSVTFDPDAILRSDTGAVVGRAGEGITLEQVDPKQASGTPEDPYIAAGILFGACYPFVP